MLRIIDWPGAAALLFLCCPLNVQQGGHARSRMSAERSPGAHMLADLRDGQTYRTLELGGLRWMAENLRYATAASGCYDDDVENCLRWGRLYSFEDGLNACPAGWRVPSDRDWMRLERELGVSPAILSQERIRRGEAGSRLRQGGGSGFDALPAGYSDPHLGGEFRRGGEAAAFWTSSLAGEDDVSRVAWHRDVNASQPGIYRSRVNVTYRLSIRCVRG